MSCYLSIIGKDLDVDAFVARTNINDFQKRYKNDLASGSKSKNLEYSSASIKISDADFENFNKQIEEVQVFLNTYRDHLKCIADTDGVEYANIHFGANSTTLFEKKVQSFYFPISLITICAELKISIETTVYNF